MASFKLFEFYENIAFVIFAKKYFQLNFNQIYDYNYGMQGLNFLFLNDDIEMLYSNNRSRTVTLFTGTLFILNCNIMMVILWPC